jgi:hypothetical protein
MTRMGYLSAGLRNRRPDDLLQGIAGCTVFKMVGERIGEKTWQIPFWLPARRAASAR